LSLAVMNRRVGRYDTGKPGTIHKRADVIVRLVAQEGGLERAEVWTMQIGQPLENEPAMTSGGSLRGSAV
jgi:hypothetical protein